MPTFNTNRPYSADGQIIDYTVVNVAGVPGDPELFGDYLDYTVEFEDTTRCIRGRVSFMAHQDDNAPSSIQARLMNEYDANNYDLI